MPGVLDSEIDSDASKMFEELQRVSEELGLSEEQRVATFEHAYEMCRFGGAEAHCVSAVMGGVVAQEVVKVSHTVRDSPRARGTTHTIRSF